MSEATRQPATPDVIVGISMFMVTDMPRSLAFYMDGLGFAMKNKWVPMPDGKIRWCWLTRGTASMMLQEFSAKQTAALTGTKLGEGVQIYFQCDDAVALYLEFTARGIQMNEPQVGNNNWEIFLRDPDGYKVAFVSQTDVPEETKLSEMKSEERR